MDRIEKKIKVTVLSLENGFCIVTSKIFKMGQPENIKKYISKYEKEGFTVVADYVTSINGKIYC